MRVYSNQKCSNCLLFKYFWYYRLELYSRSTGPVLVAPGLTDNLVAANNNNNICQGSNSNNNHVATNNKNICQGSNSNNHLVATNNNHNALKELNIHNGRYLGIEMKLRELTMTFMMLSN